MITTVVLPCWNPKEPLLSKGACRDASGCFGWEIFVGRNRVTSPNMNRVQEWGGEEHRIATGPQWEDHADGM